MPLVIKEELNALVKNINPTTKNPKIQESYEDEINPISEDSIMQEIEGIHVGPTKNYFWYMKESLLSSIDSWTKPYQKPLIMHHDDKKGKIIGRICEAKYITEGTRSGTPALRFICNVPDPEGIQQIKDGRLKTVSIGATGTDVRCSICGQQIEDLDEYGVPKCGHMKGNNYDGQTCYWEVYAMEANELSYVIIPSDIYAHNIRTYKPTKKDMKLIASYDKGDGINMSTDMTSNIQEGANIDNSIEKNSTVPTTSDKDIQSTIEKTISDEKDKKIKELELELLKVQKEKNDAIEKLDKVQKDLSVAIEKIDSLKADLKNEVTLKEAAEDMNIKSKMQIREMLENQIVTYNSVLNKPINIKESLKERTIESLNDSLHDLKEEFNNLKAVKEITPIKDPTLKESVDTIQSKTQKNNNISVKESVEDSNNSVSAAEKSKMLRNALFD